VKDHGRASGSPTRRGLGLRRSVARVLPFPRDQAAAAVWRDVVALLRGDPPRGVPVDEARLRHDLANTRDLVAAGDYDAVLAASDAVLATHPASVHVLRLRLQAQQAAGRTREALRTVRAIRRLDDSQTMARLERRLAGALLLDDTAWVPELLPCPSMVDPAGPTIVLVPDVDGHAPEPGAWVDEVLAGLVDAGVRPVVLSSPCASATGRLRPAGTEATTTSAGVARHPLDLGPGYPADPPADRAANDHAWAASIAARSIRPARIVALVVGERQHELAVGLALRAALGCPLAALVAPETLAQRAVEPLASRLRAADRVMDLGDATDGSAVDRLRGLDELAGPLPSPTGAA